MNGLDLMNGRRLGPMTTQYTLDHEKVKNKIHSSAEYKGPGKWRSGPGPSYYTFSTINTYHLSRSIR